MSKDHFQLTGVKATMPYNLRLIYADGEVLTADLQPWIASTKALYPLKNADLFVKAKRGLGDSSGLSGLGGRAACGPKPAAADSDGS
jgi:hypothetical protein